MTTPHTILLYPPTLSTISSIHNKSGSEKIDCFCWHLNLTKSFQLLVPPSEIWSPNHPTLWHHRRLNVHEPPSLPGAAFGSQHLFQWEVAHRFIWLICEGHIWILFFPDVVEKNYLLIWLDPQETGDGRVDFLENILWIWITGGLHESTKKRTSRREGTRRLIEQEYLYSRVQTIFLCELSQLYPHQISRLNTGLWTTIVSW